MVTIIYAIFTNVNMDTNIDVNILKQIYSSNYWDN